MRLCIGCELKKDETEFYERSSHSGLQSRCKPCFNHKRTQWARDNRERHNANNRQWRERQK